VTVNQPHGPAPTHSIPGLNGPTGVDITCLVPSGLPAAAS
jgi:hypothetical protein